MKLAVLWVFMGSLAGACGGVTTHSVGSTRTNDGGTMTGADGAASNDGGTMTGADGAASNDGGTMTGTDGAASNDGGTTASPGWLGVCLADSDCTDGLHCFCGVCTAPCSTPSDCARFPKGATCPNSYEETSLCIVGLPVFEFTGCVVPCSTDADCGSLGATAVCSAGFCRRPTLVSYADGAVVTCNDRTAAIASKVASVFARADRSCKTASDCSSSTIEIQCYGDPCAVVPMSRSAVTSVGAQLSAIEKQYCGDDFFEAGCVGPGASGCGEEFLPACIDGICQSSLSDGGAPSCDLLSRDIQDGLSYFETHAGLGCERDSDCSVGPLVSCAGGCGTLISKSGAAEASLDLIDIEQSLCVPFAAAACAPVALPCPFPGIPLCVNGSCEVQQPSTR